MAQQTAMQKLFTNLESIDIKVPQGIKDVYLQMENEQLKEMYLNGIQNYDPTFKRKSQWTEVDNMTRRLK